MIKGISLFLVIIFCVYYIIKLPRLLLKRDIISLKLITIELCLQNIVCIFASNVASSGFMQIIILYKEVVFWGAVIISFSLKKKFRISNYILPFIFVFFTIGLYFLVGNATVFTKLVCFRQIMTPFIMVIYGKTLTISNTQLREYLKFVVKLGLVMSILGLFERFVLGDEFWRAIHIENYMSNKGFDQWLYENGLPGNFYSADLYSSLGLVRRLVGVMADPLLTAHFLAFCVVILLFVEVFNNKSTQYIAVFIMSLTILLTLSKGAILVLCVAYLYKLWRKNKIVSLMLLIPFVLLIVIIIKQNVFYTLSAHVGGFASSIFSGTLGEGLGKAGNFANLYGAAESDIAESYMGALIGQTGLIGFIVFILAFLYWINKILHKKIGIYSNLIIAFIVAIMIESFMAESAINFVGSGVGFICFGSLLSKYINNPSKSSV